MKKIQFFALLLAGLAFVGCQKDKEPVSEGWNNGATSYLAFSISMPTDAATRAENDQFDNGEAEEYAVKDVALILFKGTNENDAVFQQAINIKDYDFGTAAGGTPNITVDKKFVEEVAAMDPAASEKILALVVLNRNGVISVTDGGSVTINNRPVSASTKFTEFAEQIAETDLTATQFHSAAGGILMLNAPLWSVQGSTTTSPVVTGAKLQMLVDVTHSLFDTKEAAMAGQAANIYVERAVAKVSIAAPASGTTGQINWAMVRWGIDNTNTKSYVLRNIDGFASEFAGLHTYAANGKYRMIGSLSTRHGQAISQGAPDNNDWYRTYFAKDPNYAVNDDFNVVSTINNAFGTNPYVYCAENTFDVDHQIWSQTTRVLVKAVLTPNTGESFYANEGDESFTPIEDVKHAAFNVAIDNYREYIKDMRTAGLLQGLADYAGSTITLADGHDAVTVAIAVTAIQPAAGLDDAAVAAANVLKPGSTTQYLQTVTDVTTALAAAPLNQTIHASDMGYKYYVGGESFYQVRIKHFGDDLTPWNNGEFESGQEPQAGALVNNAYPVNGRRNGNYLGRYGVLRNNWYHINVGGVSKIGYVSLDELHADGGSNPDDMIEKEQWINVEVNILSWAKRIQNETL